MPYYVRIRGKAFGPFDEEQLKEMKSKGKLGRTTEISENKVEWQTAENVSFLFTPSATLGLSSSAANPFQSQSFSASEPADWFYSVNGAEGYGPVTRSAILQMLQAGTLQGESLVWQQGQNAQRLNTVQAFSGQAMPSPPTAYPPQLHQPSYPQQQQQQPQQQFTPGGNLFCSACGNSVVPTAHICPQCGSPINRSGLFSSAGQKSRMTYILLALFLFGTFGSHNFYAGRTGPAVAQLILGLTIIGLFVTSIWAIIDAIVVTTDGQGVPMT